jgi:hypothetical protein
MKDLDGKPMVRNRDVDALHNWNGLRLRGPIEITIGDILRLSFRHYVLKRHELKDILAPPANSL